MRLLRHPVKRATFVAVILGAVVSLVASAPSSAVTHTGLSSALAPGPCETNGVLLELTSVVPEVPNAAQIAAQVQAQPASGCSSTAAITKLVTAAKQSTPAKWSGPTKPAPAPKKHLKLALISCASAFHGCVTPLIGVQQAAKALGWSTVMYDGGGSGSKSNADILNAISLHVDAILESDINPAIIQQGLTAAKKAGIPVISAASGSDSPNPKVQTSKGQVNPIADVSVNFVTAGRQQSDWIIQDSGGTAHVLELSDPEYSSGVSTVGSVDEFNKRCPKCTVAALNFTGSQVGTLGTEVVGYIRTHPDINYVIPPYDPSAAAIIPAIAQAGFTKVKVCSLLGIQQNIAFIRSGNVQVCDAAFDNVNVGWAMVDQLIRHLDHLPLWNPHGENSPQVLLDKTNLPAEGVDWSTPFNFRSHYKKLWR